MKRLMFTTCITLLVLSAVETICAQRDSVTVNQDAIYNRPFINNASTRTAVGGYLEGNTNYFSEDGVSEGFSMEMRRFNVFLYTQIGPRIRFLSELEFEHGTEEIALETAILDFELNPALNVRAGIILPAIGLINTNHDSPKWDFVERPLSSTGIIPTTLSEVGFGIHGKFYPTEQYTISYDAYVLNGLQDGVILNATGRTDLASGKSEEMFGEDNNGTPMFNGKMSIAHRDFGELGISYYGGTYNTFRLEGEKVDIKRQLSVFAIDFTVTRNKLTVNAEGVFALIDVPLEIREIYGEKQYGGFVDLTYQLLKKPILGFDDAVLNAALRIEYADFNVGDFTTNVQTRIGDENLGVAIALGFRPRPETVIRLNYRHHWIKDLINNPTIKLAGFQFGIASYF